MNVETMLAAIVADPDDLLARRAYADLLEERDAPGDRARAEFIRCWLAPGMIQCVSNPDAAYVWGSPWHNGRCEIVPAMSGVVCYIRRGFVEEVECETLADWMRHGPALARANPLRKVTVKGQFAPYRESIDTESQHVEWWEWHRDDVRRPSAYVWEFSADSLAWLEIGLDAREYVWRAVAYREFRTPEEAVAAMSRALIEWARKQP